MIKNRTFAGIDVGTTMTKAVIINADKKVLGRFVRRSGANLASAASVAKRILEMDTLAGRVIMTGGVVAFNSIVADLLSARAGTNVEIAPHPQEMGAFAAALYAREAEVLGGGEASLRVTVLVPDVQGELARVAGVIARLGGNICSVARFESEDPKHCYLTFRLEGVDEENLISALEAEAEEVVHVCCAA